MTQYWCSVCLLVRVEAACRRRLREREGGRFGGRRGCSGEGHAGASEASSGPHWAGRPSTFYLHQCLPNGSMLLSVRNTSNGNALVGIFEGEFEKANLSSPIGQPILKMCCVLFQGLAPSGGMQKMQPAVPTVTSPSLTLRECALSLNFWLLFFVFGCGTGVGLMFVNNLGTLTV